MTSSKPNENDFNSEVCYECRGITYKLGKSSPECFGWKSKSVRHSETIPYDCADDALSPTGKYIAIGRTFTTAKLEKENIPPVTISMAWQIPTIALIYNPKAPNATEVSIDPLLALRNPSNSTSSSFLSSQSQATTATELGGRGGGGGGGQVIRSPVRPKQSFEDIMRKGATIQYESLVRTYGEVTDNFPGRARSAATMLLKGMKITAQTMGSQLRRLVFGRDSKN